MRLLWSPEKQPNDDLQDNMHLYTLTAVIVWDSAFNFLFVRQNFFLNVLSGERWF
jgi:hypothetical protein